jgi:hypothetical protein
MTAPGPSCLSCPPPGPPGAMIHPVVARRVRTPINKKIFFIFGLFCFVFLRDVTRGTLTSPWGVTLSLRNHSWGKHPMAAIGFPCLAWAMADQLFFHRLRSTSAEPFWPKPDQAAIQPHWNEAAAATIQIRLERVEMASRVYRISLKPVYRQGHDFQLVAGTRCKRIFASRLERRAI